MNTSGGIGFIGLLTIVLIVLKATGVLQIGWLWVFAPLAISTVFAMFILLLILGMVIVAAIVDNK